MKNEHCSPLRMPQLIVGLGNPEPKYDKTRHNIGFEAIDALGRSQQISTQNHRRFQGLFGEGMGSKGRKLRLLKPLTYMNRSGQSVRAVTDWYKLVPQDVLVVYDDMDLPLGRMRMRLSGSAGGHNGMKSIISHLGTQDFPRLRIGIGKSQPSKGTISHVLGRFSPEESQIVSQMLEMVVDSIEMSLTQGIEKAMSLYNSRNLNSES